MRRIAHWAARCAFAAIALMSAAVTAFPIAHARAAQPPSNRNFGTLGAVRSSSGAGSSVVDGRIGIEVADIGAPGAMPLFVDAMKGAGAWSSAGILRLDSLGNVVALAPGQIAQSRVGAGYPTGDYTLLYDGHGTLASDAGAVIRSSPGRIILRVAPGNNGFHLILRATDPADYARNIRLIAPGYQAIYAQTPFFPSSIRALQRFPVLRFANWSHARDSVAALDWSTRSTPAQFNQTGVAGVAPEYMIALANATADDPWFVFPAGASDAYVAGFTQLVRSTLDPRLHPTFEYGDAMWNPQTGGHRYATVAGLATRLTSSIPAAAPTWYALRSAQIFGLVLQAYGYDAGRVHRVLAGPLGMPGSAELTLTDALLRTQAARLADAFAVPDILDDSRPNVTQTQALTATAAVVQSSRLALWSYDADAFDMPYTAGRAQYDALFANWHAVAGGLTVTSAQGLAPKWAGIADAMAAYPSTHLLPLPASTSRSAAGVRVAQAKRAAAPSPQPTSTAITIAQNSGVETRSTYGTFSLTLPAAPANGDMLIGIMEVTGAWQSAFPPAGWTLLDDENGAAGGHISIVYATVGSAGVSAVTSYAMATVGGGVGELLDIRGQSSAIAPIAAADPSTFATTVTRSLTIPAAGGMAITAAGLYSTGSATSLADTLPANYTESNLVNAINGLSSEGNTFSLKTNVINQDAYSATQPFTFTTTATASVGSFPNSTMVWIAPAWASTPAPTPTPTTTPTPTPTPTPTATPVPSPTPTLSTSIAIAQNSGVEERSSYGTFSLTLPKAPANGDLLVGIMEVTGAWQSTFPPAGWTVLDNTNGATGGHISVVYATVGSGGVGAATSYAMATVGGGVGELLDVRGQSAVVAPIAATDLSTYATTVARSLTIPTAGGLAITAAGLFSSGTASALTDTLPKNYTESNLVNAINGLSSEGNTFSLKTNVIPQDVYNASQPFTFTTTATASVGSFPNSTLIWIAPAGASTPVPTPTPTATPTPTPTATPIPSPTPTLSTSITIAQNSGVETRSSYGTLSLTLPAVPANGDTLLGIMEVTGAWQSAFPPAGWTVLDNTNGAAGGHISIVYATVGSGGVPAATSYAMATVGGGVGELLDIRGQSSTIAPIAANDPSTFATAVMRSLTIPTAGGLAITAAGLFSTGTATSLADTLPSKYTESNLVNALNGLSSEGNTFSLKTSVIPQDVFNASQPFTFTTTATASVGSFPNSTLVWIAPSAAVTPTPSPSPSPTAAFNNWPTYGYDNAHDGYNPNSQLFTAANVANLHLGWQSTIPDYLTQTQPILATNVAGHAGLLFAGGASGTAYAYDALTGAQVWHTPSFGQIQFQCDGSTPTVGISGTPVYDPSANVVYFVDGTNASPDAPSTITLYELNAATGAVLASVNLNPGNLPGEVDYAHTGLTLANGMLYFGTGSTCDVSAWRGRLAAINVGTMSLANTFFTVYNQGGAYSGGGVWDWAGATIDASGNAYIGVGNADYNQGANGPQPPFIQTTSEQVGYGEHLVQLTGDLSTVNQSYAVPYTFSATANDLDLSGSPVVYTPLGCPQLVAVQGKAGLLNIYNASTIGSGPLTTYQFSEQVGDVSYIGNGTYSPITGLYYANVPTSQGGSIRPPGMVAIGGCTPPAIQWSAQFGADSYEIGAYNGATRSAPSVTAGNVVFVATPTSAGTGQVWAIDATAGTVLNGGQPILATGNQVLMPPVIDGEWMYVLDQGGNLYGLTLEAAVPAIKAKFHHIALPKTHER